MTKRSSLTGLGRRRRGASERRLQSRSTPSEAKAGSLWTCGPASSPAATPKVCQRPPDSTRGSPHSGEFHQWLPGPFQWTPWSRSSWWCPQPWASTLPPPKGCPMHWAVPSSIEPSGFAFWGCWQWSCCHELDRYRAWVVQWRISDLARWTLCHFDMIEGSYRSWDLYTTGQLVDGLQQKTENRFSLNGNGIMSSFLGRQFYHSTLYSQKHKERRKEGNLLSHYALSFPSLLRWNHISFFF